MGYYITTGMKKFGEMLLTGVCTALVLWAFKFGMDTVLSRIEESDKRAKRIEDKLGQYITREEFNQILEAKLKQFKVSKDGKLIITNSGY